MSQSLDSITLERLVTAAVSAVLAEMAGRPAPVGRLVPVLVGESLRGVDFAAASLRTVAHLPVNFDWVVAGPGLDRVKALVPDQPVRDAASAGCPLALARQAEAVVVAGLDRPTAMRVALTLPETFGSKLLFEALCLGKPVIVATDALGLTRPDATPQLRHALAEPVGRLEVFGAQCVPAEELGAAVKVALSGPAGVNAHENRPLITAEDVEAAGPELLLPPGAIVTPLALDRARELGVVLRHVPT